jgi:hypothetical protein
MRVSTLRSLAAMLAALAFAALPAVAAEEPAPPADLAPADRLGAPQPEVGEEPAAESEDCCGDEGPNRGRVSLSFNNDFVTAYFFRGILQERNGFIWQPSLDIGINLYEGEGALTSLDIGVGTWNSVHSNKTGESGSGPTNWYESDVYPSLSATFVERVETSLTYQVYTSPNGAFATIQNLDLGLAFDDSELWGDAPFSLSPSALLSFELDRTNFGEEEGVFLGFELEPAYVLLDGEEYPITVAAPLALGLSLSDYYEDESGDDTFGYFSFGLGFSVPLAFIPEDFGSWSTSIGIDVYVLGDNLKEFNEGDSPFPVGILGVLMEY